MSSTTQLSLAQRIICSALSWIVFCPIFALATPVTARPSDWIANSIGVNTHFDYQSYHSQDESYFQQVFKPLLIASGIRHLRDHTGATSDYTAIQRYARRLAELSAAGMDVIMQSHPDPSLADMGTENPDPNAALGLRTKLRAFMRGDIVLGNKLIPRISGLRGVMHPNEWDHIRSFDATCLVQGDWYTRLMACNPTWFDELSAYMQNLHATMQDPELQGLTLYGPTLVHIESYRSIQLNPNETLWDRMQTLNQYFDVGAVNFYAWPRPHTSGFAYYLNPRAQYYGNKRFIISEMGNYNQSFGQVDIYGVSKQVQAIYLLRGLVEHLRRDPESIQYIYELYDQGNAPYPQGAPTVKEGSFGIIENDGTPKLAYTGVKNLIALTSDKDAQFTPQPLDMQVVSTSATVHSIVTQKSDGRYLLLLWDENPNVSEGNYRTVPARIQFGQEWDLNLYDPLVSASTPVGSWSATSALDLNVPDSVIAIELTVPQPPTAPVQATPTVVATNTPSSPGDVPIVDPIDDPSDPITDERLCSLSIKSNGSGVVLRLMNSQIVAKERILVRAAIGQRTLWKKAIRVLNKRVYKIRARSLSARERAQVTIDAMRMNAPKVAICTVNMRSTAASPSSH